MLDRRGLACALVLAVGVLGCSPTAVATILPTAAPSPSPAPTTTPTATPASPTESPTAAPSVAVGAAACEVADLKATRGPVEGAAGSRLTTVVLVAAIPCSIDAFPALGLRDANGAILVGAAAAGPGRIDLSPDASYESNVRVGNWCGGDPDFPLALEIVVGGEELPVTGGSFPEAGDLPPCNGDGGPVLDATGWVPQT